jgi:mannose-1-phosphate guanylyltransferase
MKLLILAGGSGTRLWPLSRISKPKQIQPFLDSFTLLQRTWRRLRQGFKAQDIFISTTKAHFKEIKRQLPQLLSKNIIVEPVARNTAPAIGLAALVINKMFPEEIVATVNSDHYIGDNKAYIKALKSGEKVARLLPDNLLLLGIKPTYPETGYGYIKLGKSLLNKNGVNIFKVMLKARIIYGIPACLFFIPRHYYSCTKNMLRHWPKELIILS